jgi:hypothetical protein
LGDAAGKEQKAENTAGGIVRVRLTGAGQPNKFGSRTVSYSPPRHSGVGFRRDF